MNKLFSIEKAELFANSPSSQQVERSLAQQLADTMRENFQIKSSLSVLAEVHLREDTGTKFCVMMGAMPEYYHNHQRYVSAWEHVWDILHPQEQQSNKPSDKKHDLHCGLPEQHEGQCAATFTRDLCTKTS